MLRNTGVTVVSVGFGEETPYMKYALEAMASDPKDQYRFIFDYGDVMEGVNKVIAVACQGSASCYMQNFTLLYSVYSILFYSLLFVLFYPILS